MPREGVLEVKVQCPYCGADYRVALSRNKRRSTYDVYRCKGIHGCSRRFLITMVPEVRIIVEKIEGQQ